MISESKSNIPIFLLSAVLLMMVWADSGMAAVRFDVVGSPTEVIHTGRSEVLGSISLFVRGTGNVTGTSLGGATQIGFLFAQPALQIDNTDTSGILVFSSSGFAAAVPTLISIENREIGGRCMGVLTLNLPPGATPAEGDFIRIEGIRGRIDASEAVVPGTDLFVDLQSINDPSAVSFTPDRLRVAKSFEALTAGVLADAFSFRIIVTEVFARSFVDMDANDDGINANDRTDSAAGALGAPTNSTQVSIRLRGIPGGISQVIWPAVVPAAPASGAELRLRNSAYSAGSSTALYSFEALDQTGSSDVALESFSVAPGFVFSGGDCNASDLEVSVSLAPAVRQSEPCAGPSADAARPRFLEAFALMVTRLNPSSVVVGGTAFTMRVMGSGFVAGSTVYWDGTALPTTFLSDTQLDVTVPPENIARVGTATVNVINPPASGGSISNPAVFTIKPHALSLFFPRLAGAERESTEATGIALVNLSGRTTALTLTAFDAEGKTIAGDGILNPVTLSLTYRQQSALVDSEIFGAGLRNASKSAWIRLEGDVTQVSGFFLSFDGGMTRLDGTDVSGATLTSFVFPELDEGTLICIANPNDDPATVSLRLMKADGTLQASVSRRIEAKGMLSATADQIFPGAPLDPTGYIRGDSTLAVVPYESFGPSSADFAALNGQDAEANNRTIYSPQYAVGGPDWQSTLSVVNLDADPGTVRFRLLADDGSQIGDTREMPVAAQGKLLITEQDFFLDPGTELKQGFVEITAIGVRLSGNVTFGSPVTGKLLASLPLTPAIRSRLLFGQIASDDDYYTGLAVLNPGGAPARVSIQVYDINGNLLAGKIEDIPSRGRISQMLTNYFPELAERKISGGYIMVDSIDSLSAFAVFGTRNLLSLAAVPPQIF